MTKQALTPQERRLRAQKGNKPQYQHGKLGILVSGAYVFQKPFRPGYCYCRIEHGVETEIGECIAMTALDPYARVEYVPYGPTLLAMNPNMVDAVQVYGAQAVALTVPSLPMSLRGGIGDLTPSAGTIMIADGSAWITETLDAAAMAYMTKLLTGNAVARTIASGVLTGGAESVITVAPESGTTDDLRTLTVTGAARDLWLIASTGATITLKQYVSGADNIFMFTAADLAFTDAKAVKCWWNGTNLYVVAGGGSATAYYQTVQDNGSDQTQRGKLNLIGATVADNAGNDSTDVTLPTVGGAVTVLDVNDTSVGNVGGGTDDLITFTVPGGTLANNGDYLHGKMSGSFAGNVNSKTLTVVFGSTTLFSTGALAVAAAADWVIEYWIERIGATSERCSIAFTSSFGTLMGDSAVTDASEDLTTSLVLKCTGAGTSNDDILQKSLSVEKYSASSGTSGNALALIILQDQKTAGTSGGTFTSGAWRTRDLNTVLVDTGSNCSLSSNQITLLAGTYRVRIVCPAYRVQRHKARLQNISDSTTLLLGTSAFAAPNDPSFGSQGDSWIIGRFTISATKILEVQDQCTATASSIGFGVESNLGVTEIYTVAEFEKE